MNGRYLIARYVKDLDRGESLNIGIIVWTKGACVARLMKTTEANFIDDIETYQRWINHWQDLVSKRKIAVLGQKPVTVGGKRFLDQILLTQKGNFTLSDGGFVFDDVTPENIEKVADFLFEKLVMVRRSNKTPEPSTFVQRCTELLEAAGITREDGFHQRFKVNLRFPSYEKQIHFHYGIGNGKPDSLYQRVNLQDEKSVTSAVGRFEPANRLNLVDLNNSFSIFDSDGESDEPTIKNTILFLKDFSIPVDIYDFDQAIDTVQGRTELFG